MPVEGRRAHTRHCRQLGHPEGLLVVRLHPGRYPANAGGVAVLQADLLQSRPQRRTQYTPTDFPTDKRLQNFTIVRLIKQPEQANDRIVQVIRHPGRDQCRLFWAPIRHFRMGHQQLGNHRRINRQAQRQIRLIGGGLHDPGVHWHIDGRQQALALAIMKSRLPNRRYLGPLQYDAERGLIKGSDGAAGFQGVGQA